MAGFKAPEILIADAVLLIEVIENAEEVNVNDEDCTCKYTNYANYYF